MKNLIIAIILLFGIKSFGQESFKKAYFIPNTVNFKKGLNIYLVTDGVVMFKDMTREEQENIKDSYRGIEYVEIKTDELINGKKFEIIRNVKVDSKFFESLTKRTSIEITDKKVKGFVKFEEDGKLIVNRFLKRDSNGDYTSYPLHYYQLQNRQVLKLRFSEINVSALTMPFKYRFKGANSLQEDFSTAINGNIFIGYSLGQTSFFHQEKVGNISNTWKITPGLLLGASSVVLDKNNTDLSESPITGDSKFTKGLGSIALGITYSFNKINFGAFYGYDYAIGNYSNRWNYNKKPWLGIAIGYSVLNF